MVELDATAALWLALLTLSAVLTIIAVTAQAALIHSSRARLRLCADGGLKSAEWVLRMLEEGARTPSLILVMVLVGTGGAIASMLAISLLALPTLPWVAGGFIAVSVVLLLLLCAVGRGIAMARPEMTAMGLARLIRLIRLPMLVIGGPFVIVERQVATLLADQSADPSAPDEELRLLVESVEDARPLDEDEREMIHGIFEMSQRPVRDVMVPRVDIVAVAGDATLGDVLDRIVASGNSRIPIFALNVDDVEGVVYAKDILRSLRLGKLDDPASPIARPPYFVPDSKKVDELLQDLQRERIHMAIVVDEYGGTAGLVTIEDLIEEIVGEIQDEYDVNEEEPIKRVDERVSMVDPRVAIRDVNEELDLHLSDDQFDTLGGLVYHQLGKVPVEGDQVRVNGCLVTVAKTQGRRIRRLRVTIEAEDA
jgi:CBS domain containing-hemolysin-like protein